MIKTAKLYLHIGFVLFLQAPNLKMRFCFESEFKFSVFSAFHIKLQGFPFIYIFVIAVGCNTMSIEGVCFGFIAMH